MIINKKPLPIFIRRGSMFTATTWLLNTAEVYSPCLSNSDERQFNVKLLIFCY